MIVAQTGRAHPPIVWKATSWKEGEEAGCKRQAVLTHGVDHLRFFKGQSGGPQSFRA
jgi:hypothetical protein